MTHTAKLIAAIATCLFGIGCYLPVVSPALANPPPPNSTHLKPQIIILTGRIKKVEVEGGCYQLAADNGQNYELIGKFPKRDGIKVRLRGEVVKDIVTICQVGQPIKVKSVQIIRSK